MTNSTLADELELVRNKLTPGVIETADLDGMALTLGKAIASLRTPPTSTDERKDVLEAQVERLKEHLSEQITHVETRIQDGAEMGAAIWRIALEDVARENRAALTTKGD